jgi:hypothetical protein
MDRTQLNGFSTAAAVISIERHERTIAFSIFQMTTYEMVLTYLKALPRHSPEETKKIYEKPSQNIRP